MLCVYKIIFSKYFKFLVCFGHLAVAFGAPANVVPERGFGMGCVRRGWGCPVLSTADPSPAQELSWAPQPPWGRLESAWIRGTCTQRRETEQPWPEQEEVLHIKGTVAHGWAHAGAGALPKGPWPLEGLCWRRNKWEGRRKWRSGKKRKTGKNCCDLTLQHLAITQGAEFSSKW